MNGLRSNSKQEHDSPDLEPVIASIVRYAKPSRILLFGSRARQESRLDSDIDIGAVDLVVYEENSFNERAKIGNSFEARIQGEGVYLYGQA